jgi:hypothetical protein
LFTDADITKVEKEAEGDGDEGKDGTELDVGGLKS